MPRVQPERSADARDTAEDPGGGRRPRTFRALVIVDPQHDFCFERHLSQPLSICRQAVAEHGVAQVSAPKVGVRTRTCTSDPTGAQYHAPDAPPCGLAIAATVRHWLESDLIDGTDHPDGVNRIANEHDVRMSRLDRPHNRRKIIRPWWIGPIVHYLEAGRFGGVTTPVGTVA